jgi:hypothetical protein
LISASVVVIVLLCGYSHALKDVEIIDAFASSFIV